MRVDLTAMVVSCPRCGAVAFGGDATSEQARHEGYATAEALRMEVRLMSPAEARQAMQRFGDCSCEGAHAAGVSGESPCSPNEEVTR